MKTELIWHEGPANGGEGTAGGDWWEDGDFLMVIIELKNGGREVLTTHVSAGEEGVGFNDINGDDIGWGPESIAWWAQIPQDSLPTPSSTPASTEPAPGP